VARKRASPAPLRFRGTPRALEALAPVALDLPADATLVLEAVAGRRATATIEPVALQSEAAGASATWLRFDLPLQTPPGTYEGGVQVGPDRYPVTIEVQPLPDLDVTPSQLSLTAVPGGRETVELTLVNNGNVPVAIERAYAFNLLEPSAIEEAFHSALREHGRSLDERLHRLAEQLDERHGGLVRVAVEAGSGALDPGEIRDVRAVLRFGKELRRGATYTTTWAIGNLNLWIEVAVQAEARQRRRRETA
jgi:hypothetical protein